MGNVGDQIGAMRRLRQRASARVSCPPMSRRLLASSSIVLPLVLALAACDPATTPPPPADAGPADAGAPDTGPPYDPYAPPCEGLDPTMCILPWPSSRYLEADTSTATGFRISIPDGATPTNNRRVPVDPSQWDRFDGFSPFTSMVTAFPVDVDTSNLPDERHIADSLAADSPTVLLEVASDGSVTRVAHFAEVDTWPQALATERPFYIRPAARLRTGTRYVVAIRDLTDRTGAAVAPSPYFAALRDGTSLAEAEDLEGRRAHFEEIFGFLDDAGLTRSELILAWDFVTGTDDVITSDLLTARDRGHLALDDAGVSCTIGDVEAAPAAEIARRIHGTFRVPLFIGGTDSLSMEESRLRRDASGLPESTRMVEVPFVANIPNSVVDRIAAGTGGPGRLLAYGHGLFGSRFETSSGWFRQTIAELEMVSIATDWWGMSEDDVPRVTLTLTEFSTFDATGERLVQGMVNIEMMVRSFRELCIGAPDATNPFYVVPTGGGDPVLAYDPAERYYYGNSQGGIMGTTFAGMSLEVDRFVAGVGGVAYSVMIPRSSNWQTYGVIMRNGYRRFLDGAVLMTMSQSLWDLAEPSSYAGHIVADPLPCTLDATRCPGGLTPIHHILYQIGVDDDQVANITADMGVRTMGIPVLTPSPYEPFGVPTTTTAVDSAMVIYTIPGTPVLPLGTRDPGTADNPAHEGVRRSAAARAQIDAFCRPDGLVTPTCTDVCDPD